MEQKITFKMSPKAILLYRARLVAITITIAFFCGALMAFFAVLAVVLSVAVIVVAVISFFWYPVMLYKNHLVTITSESLCVSKGVVFLRNYYTSMSNVCYISKITTPLQRFFGIFTLCLYTKSGKIYLSNLEAVPDIFAKLTND
ncbi:MAG: PH domain-containing protein [Acutalibacteraceae bacterium]|nr:PH domain-containing protein [Acutalibacteraceae bacterium]